MAQQNLQIYQQDSLKVFSWGVTMGSIKIKTDRVGEKVLQKNGMTAEIIEYHRSSNITVRFEDGKIVSHVSYYNFVKEIS